MITRVLADSMLAGVPSVPAPRTFVLPDGRFDLPGLLVRFADFWHVNEDVLHTEAEPYRETSPHLVLLGYLDRAVNGGGFVDREYGVGRRRMDLLVRWNHAGADGRPAVQREALELKTHRPDDADPTKEGIRQLDAYLTRLGLPTGYLVVFDQRPAESRRAGTKMGARSVTSPSGRAITVVRI